MKGLTNFLSVTDKGVVLRDSFPLRQQCKTFLAFVGNIYFVTKCNLHGRVPVITTDCNTVLMGKIIVFLFSLTRESGYLSYLSLPNSHFQKKKIIDDFFLIKLAFRMAFLCRG